LIEYIADILLAAGALGAGLYCYVLGRRLNKFNNLEKGVGGAVAVLSAQVDDLTKTLTAAQMTASQSAQSLTELTTRAQDMSQRLELQMASLHDIPAAPEPPKRAPEAVQSAPQRASIPPSAAEPMFIRHSAGGGR